MKLNRFACSFVLPLSILFSPLLAAGASAYKAPKLPRGYKLIYQQNFEKPSSIEEFEFTDPKSWRLTKEKGNTVLELFGASTYKPPVRSPAKIGIIAGKHFGDFILEADILQTGREYGHRDMCIFLDVQSPSRFYYVHLASAADDHAHNIFIVNEQPRTKIGAIQTQGVQWGDNQWHKIRLERKMADGSIKVFFDDMTSPVMTATDKTFDTGCIGFGSFDDTGKIDNIKVWAPLMLKRQLKIFR